MLMLDLMYEPKFKKIKKKIHSVTTNENCDSRLLWKNATCDGLFFWNSFEDNNRFFLNQIGQISKVNAT